MKKTILASLLAATLSTAVFADNVIMQNEYIKVGVNETTGTLGSGGNTNPGIQYDNSGTSTFNSSYDYLTPGSPYEGWAVRIDNTDGTQYKLYGNNNAGFQSDGNTAVTGAWVGTPTASSAVWAGSATEFDIRHTYSLPSTQKFLDITTRLDAKEAMPHLYFGRYIDPDAVAVTGDSSATDNVRGYGAVPKANVVFSEATVSRYALGLYSGQVGGVNTAIQGWSSDPKTYYTDTKIFYEPLLDSSGNKVYVDATRPWMGYQRKLDSSGNPIAVDYGNGDDTIGIAFYANNVAVGDILTWKYAYIFGPSAFGAANSAITGGAGGSTPGVVPGGGTLVDVGSATDSASSGTTTPPAPTVTSTSTATITVSDTTVVNTSLPVITASLAHHNASEASGKQTIARETTTNVTTPYTRSVSTLVRTTSNWSDGTTTTSDSATTTSDTLINNVDTSVANDSFSGRVDQMSYLNNLNKQLDRGLNMDAFRKDAASNGDVKMYVNAVGARSSMGDGYNAKSQIYGLGVEKEIKSNWSLGAQYNRVRTTMDGTDSNTAQDKNHVGLFSVYTTENDIKVVNNLGYANNDIKSSRTVENVFNNSHTTTGNNLWLNNRVYAPDMKGFRPYAGVTVGKSTTGGYEERGDIQSQRIVNGVTNNYSFGEGGVRYEKAIDDLRLVGDVNRTTDGITTGAATIAYAPTKTGVIALTAATQTGDNINTKTISLRGIIKF
jgi:hypothetical protein